jgi:small-conductance mechanosensitive channel
LNSTKGSQVLARRLYRTYAHEDSKNIYDDDIRNAFDNDEEAEATFRMFDKDMNGDISMEELEAVCVEIGRERKAITASLKDLDSVVSKLDNVFMVIILLITILVFVSIISTSASTALTSLGSTVLALSWLFAATAQEFLQSLIFVFVKHPFDVGDRVTIYGNTGTQGRGDDYYVKEISLLFTEFKKMEGHVVQAPNSYLNTLFILNQRRSGSLAEAIPVTVKFGTTLEQIDRLRRGLLEFVTSEDREYQRNIVTELTTIYEAYSVTLNVIVFYKSNWQNEYLRLQRRNKFICAMMVSMQELGIEGPRLGTNPGSTRDHPMFSRDLVQEAKEKEAKEKESKEKESKEIESKEKESKESKESNQPQSPEQGPEPSPRATSIESPPTGQAKQDRHPSILRHRGIPMTRQRGESISEMGKRIDFSLGMQGISSGQDMGDVYDKPKPRLPSVIAPPPPPIIAPPSREAERPRADGEAIFRRLSHGSQLSKIASSNSLRTHKNRFFGRSRVRRGTTDGTNPPDLESGKREFAPESSAFNSPDTVQSSRDKQEAQREGIDRAVTRDSAAHVTHGNVTLDPSTSNVSSQAAQSDSDAERKELRMSEGGSAAAEEARKKRPWEGRE